MSEYRQQFTTRTQNLYFLCIVGTKRPKLCEMPLVSRFVGGVGQSARVGLLALFAFPATLVGPPNQKLRRLQSTKTPHFQHICPGVWGDTSTQYATVINKKLCELCYMSAISSGKFQWIYRALLNLLLHAFNPTEAFSIWRATSIDILLSKYI